MKITNVVKLATVSAAAVLLAACTHGNTNSGYQSASGGANGAQSYGIGSNGSGYQTTGTQTAANGMHINSLSAPSDQTYYFDFASNQVHSADYRALTAQANYLAAHPNARVRLEGNTDNRGSREYNIGLGWRRDQTVARFLKQRGVSASQIQAVSYGKEHPAAFGDNAKSWALNRRVNLVYKTKG